MSDTIATVTPAALSEHEREDLAACEAVIEVGRDAFLQVGAALLAIRDRRLYREAHPSFDAYLTARWGFTRQRAHQLIEAADVARNLSTTVDSRHVNERQARVLAPLTAEEQRIVYRLAKGTAPDGKVTAAHLRSLVTVVDEVMRVRAIDDGSGVMVPWDALSEARKLAFLQLNVTEETFERHARQQDALQRVLSSSASAEWYTPALYVEAARAVLGGIDVDPASCAQANATVRAACYFTVEDDGLARDWPGRVFLNPPYGRLHGAFVAHLVDQYAQGITTAAIVVLNLHAVDNPWFRPLWDHTLCFAAARVDFVRPDGGPSAAPHGSVFVYLGPDPVRFAAVFRPFGAIVRQWHGGGA